ncbi:DUF998 domain-containing protein [Clostridium oceanicum]|uniref:DUF998 domain-containing protein n=1 Tax=Clostridium oceanicum TaxID=1543 RepID=A0ABN1JLD3_9CLOT
MNKVLDSEIFNILLVLTVIGEFFIPWVLKHFYEGYDSKKMVMSVLGSPKSPVRYFYNAWLIWLGGFLLFTAIAFLNNMSKVSGLLAILMFISIAAFAIGAGLLAGIFSVNESKDVVTFASKIHGAGAAIGFMTLLFFPLLSAIVAFKEKNTMMGNVCVIAFVLAIIFFVFFIMGDKEKFKNTVFSYEGLWQRLTLLAMYTPFVYRGIVKLVIMKG